MATLRELSERTGYSPATISRILTGDPALSVTPEARARVLEEAGRLDYAATRSRRGRTPKPLLRVGVAEMLTPAERLRDPYYLYLSEDAASSCRESRCTEVTLARRGDGFILPEGETVDGVIAIGIFSRMEVECLKALSPHVVFLDSSPDELHCDSVVLNYRLGIEQALEHLWALGHRDIGFVGPAEKLDDWKQPAPETRRQTFLNWMAQRGGSDPLLLECPMESNPTAGAVAAFLQSSEPCPTALLAANEETAMGVVRALRDAGKNIPGDVSVISFNDTPLSGAADPPLTAVSTHVREMARTAVRLLLQRAKAEAERTLPQKVVIPPTLTIRESTAPPRFRKDETHDV